MSYLTFLLVWIVPVIVVLALLKRAPLAGVGTARARWALPLVCAIAFVYTTPWDNYLVWRGVWGYGNARVMGTIGYVPVEEYLFFLLQPIMTGLLLYRVLERWPQSAPLPSSSASKIRYAGVAITGLSSLWGVYLLVAAPENATYLGLILAWAVPVVMGMWLYAGPHLWAWRRPVAAVLAASTLYLWVADRYAIQNGIWHIAPGTRLGIDPFGLPIEEATFFFVTNVLCVFGTMLFLHGDRIRPFWRAAPAHAR